jgi:hypothetical protein
MGQTESEDVTGIEGAWMYAYLRVLYRLRMKQTKVRIDFVARTLLIAPLGYSWQRMLVFDELVRAAPTRHPNLRASCVEFAMQHL